MDRLMAMRIKRSDGTYSEEIPIGALTSNVVFETGETLEHYLNTLEEEVEKIKNGGIDPKESAVVGLGVVGSAIVGNDKVPTARIGSAAIGSTAIGEESGSSSGGGGVLKINYNDETRQLDKITQQILDAWDAGITCIIVKFDEMSEGDHDEFLMGRVMYSPDNNKYSFYTTNSTGGTYSSYALTDFPTVNDIS